MSESPTDDRPTERRDEATDETDRPSETAEAEDDAEAAETRRGRRRRRRTTPARRRRRRRSQDRLENEGDIAADYLEELLDIADLDGDLDMDVEGERAVVSDRGRRPVPARGRPRRGARGPPGADPARGLPRDRRALAADARRLRPPRRGAPASSRSWPRRTVAQVKETGERVALRADDAVRAQGRARRGRRRRPDVGVRGRRAPSLRGGPARLMADVSRETPPSPDPAVVSQVFAPDRLAAASSGTPRCWRPRASSAA